MEISVKTQKTKFSFSLTTEFFYSELYPILLALFTVFCFATKMQLGGVFAFVVIACFLLVRIRDLTPILPLLMNFIFLFNDLDVLSNPFFYCLVAPVFVCYVIHLIKYPAKFVNLGQLFLPLCLVTVALLLGGVFSPYADGYVKGMLYTIPLGPVLLAVYLIFANGLKYPQGFDIRRWIAHLTLMVGLICAMEFFWLNFDAFVIRGVEKFKVGELGWGNVNTVATMMLLAIPCTCYLVVKTERFLVSFLTVLALYYAIFLTKSDGCLGISLAYLPFLALFVFLNLSKNKRKIFVWLVAIVVTIAVIYLFVLCIKNEFNKIIDFIKNSINGESGRSKLYNDALRMFERYPMFGVGFGYYNDYAYTAPGGELRLFNFHSTFFHVLASMGMVGVIAYAYYFYQRFKILARYNTPFNLFTFIAFSMFTCYGMIDCVEFATIPSMINVCMIILCCEFANLKGPDKKTLPLQN